MADRRGEDAPVAPRRTLSSPQGTERPVLPPPPEDLKSKDNGAAGAARAKEGPSPVQRAVEKVRAAAAARPQPRPRSTAKDAAAERAQDGPQTGTQTGTQAQPRTRERPLRPTVASSHNERRSMRKARLRLVQVDAWSVMKTAFLLSLAIGIVTVVAVAVIWGVLGAAGVWDSINSMVQQTLGSDTSQPFQIQDYIGTSRVLGFTMIVAVVDVILITAIATLGAFVYNLAATLVGGIEVTLAEDS